MKHRRYYLHRKLKWGGGKIQPLFTHGLLATQPELR